MPKRSVCSSNSLAPFMFTAASVATIELAAPAAGPGAIFDAMLTTLPPDVPCPLLRLQRATRMSTGFRRGLSHGAGDSRARTCRFPRSACLRHVARTARRGDQACRGAALQGADVVALSRRAHSDWIRLRAVSRDRLDRRVVPARMDLLRHAAVDVAGEHFRGRGL